VSRTIVARLDACNDFAARRDISLFADAFIGKAMATAIIALLDIDDRSIGYGSPSPILYRRRYPSGYGTARRCLERGTALHGDG
jgi:hypothetical protein